MIKKVVSIQRVGRFEKFNARGNVEFGKLTLIFAENARGKTTFSDILRSASSGDPDPVRGRQTLGGAEPSEIDLLLDSGAHLLFKNGSWSSSGLRTLVYDSAFVNENVYAGDFVGHEHKKNLYRVIVGEKGVELAKKVDDCDAKIRELNRDIAVKRDAMAAFIPAGIPFDDFIKLGPEENIEAQVADKEKQLFALQRAKEIKQRALQKAVEPPGLPSSFDDLLGRAIEGISKGAEARVRLHLSSHASPFGESWLQQGLELSNGRDCPFCGQPISGIALVSTFQEYFSQAYTSFKRELSDLRRAVEDAFGQGTLLAVQEVSTGNNTLGEFWGQFVQIAHTQFPFAEFRAAASSLKNAALTCIDRKIASPLEVLRPDSQFESATVEYEKAEQLLQAYNATVRENNALISEKKLQAEAGEISKSQADLNRLKAIKRRFEPPVDEACNQFNRLVVRKSLLESEKVTAKKELDDYTEKVFSEYERRINKLLSLFNAGFRISGTGRRFVGGTPSSSFQILINDTPVDLGDASTPKQVPSFRNTLSAGDRSALALAFFVARTERDPDLPNRVILLDDPFTSQDRTRRHCTQELVRTLVPLARQVIVLSHDPGFLKEIGDGVEPLLVRTLQFCRTASRNTKVEECDLDEIVQGAYFQAHNTLWNFAHFGRGDPGHVVRCIRPMLEGYLRMKQPREFNKNEWLGDMIKKIKLAAPGTPLHEAQCKVQELEELNDYSKRYHHQGQEADAGQIDDGELQGYCRLTLELVETF